MHRQPSKSSTAGFTILEVVVALVLLAGALSGVAGLLTVSFRATRQARVQTSTTLLAAQKLEQLRSLTWASDAGGLPQSDLETDLCVDPPGAGGLGLQPSPGNALTENVSGYVDYLGRRGEWVGTGVVPPSEAVYARRWSIEPLAEDPADTLVLQVLVTAASWSGPSAARLPGDAAVVSVVTRKSR